MRAALLVAWIVVVVAGGCGPKPCPKGDVDACTKACDEGHDGSCGELVLAADGFDRAARAQAVALYDKACAKTGVVGCARLAQHLSNGDGVAQDYARAAQVLEGACAKDDLEACWRLGVANRDGLGVIQDSKRARTLLKRACDASVSEACMHLAKVR